VRIILPKSGVTRHPNRPPKGRRKGHLCLSCHRVVPMLTSVRAQGRRYRVCPDCRNVAVADSSVGQVVAMLGAGGAA